MYPIFILCGKAGSGKDTVAEMLKKHGSTNIALADPMKRLLLNSFGVAEENLWGPSEKRSAKIELDNSKLFHICYDQTMNIFYEDMDFGEKNVDYRFSSLSTEIYNFICCEIFKVHPDIWERAERMSGHPVPKSTTVREFLQKFGTGFIRSKNYAHFTDKAISDAESILLEGFEYTPQGGLNLTKAYKRPAFVTITDGRFADEILAVKKLGGIAILVKNPHENNSAGNHLSETELDSIPIEWYDCVIRNDKTLGIENLENQVKNLIDWAF